MWLRSVLSPSQASAFRSGYPPPRALSASPRTTTGSTCAAPKPVPLGRPRHAGPYRRVDWSARHGATALMAIGRRPLGVHRIRARHGSARRCIDLSPGEAVCWRRLCDPRLTDHRGLSRVPPRHRELHDRWADIRATMLCLYLGVRWLRGNGGRITLLASLAIGVLAVSIREFAVAAPAAILMARGGGAAAMSARGWPPSRSCSAAALALLLNVAASIRVCVPLRGSLAPDLPWPGVTTFAALLLPAIAPAVGHRIRSLRPEAVIVAAGLVVVGLVLPYGSLSREPVDGERVWWQRPHEWCPGPSRARCCLALSTQLASFAGILLCGAGAAMGAGPADGLRSSRQ